MIKKISLRNRLHKVRSTGLLQPGMSPDSARKEKDILNDPHGPIHVPLSDWDIFSDIRKYENVTDKNCTQVQKCTQPRFPKIVTYYDIFS
jgi:hypothetical protein